MCVVASVGGALSAIVVISAHAIATIDGRHECSPKVKPKRLDHHLVAGCSIGPESCLLHVSGCLHARWQRLYPGYFGFISGWWENVSSIFPVHVSSSIS